MTLEPARGEDVVAACAVLRARGPYPASIAAGLARDDPEQMRAAFAHLIEARRVEGLRDLVERFRPTSDLGVWARVTSAQIYRVSGDFAAGIAEIEELIAQFPAHAAPYWWVAKARCLEGLGRIDEAAAAAREAIARFPRAAPPHAYLANLLARSGRSAESLEAWEEAHRRFPDPDLPWFEGLANALKAAGRDEEALRRLEEAGRRFPGDRRQPPMLARVAEERGDWARALGIWREGVARFGEDAESEIGQSRALFQLGQVEAATTRLDSFLARAPDHVTALRERATMATELGEAERAREILARLTDRVAALSRPEWWASLARAHHDLGDLAAGAAALAELERRFPDSALAERERLRLARREERGLEDLHRLIEAARRRFPEDADLRSQWVWILLSLGRLEEAESHVAALEAEAADGFALAARLKLEADRGDASFRAFSEKLAAGRVWTAADAAAFAYAMLDVRAPWAFALGADALEAAPSGGSRLTLLRIRLAIARRRDDEALALIDAIPAPYRRREVLELRAWSAARRGRDDEAKRLWTEALARDYYPAVHFPVTALTRVSPDDRPPPAAGPTAFVVFRNEAAQIPEFLAHHRRLGVRRFVFVDHRSTDAGRDLALREPDVIVYDAPESYQLSWSGRRWINAIVAREGARGWGLQLDMDERLVYPACETVPLDRFVAYLDARGFEAVRGFMLDLIPPRLVDEAGLPLPFAEHRGFDDDYDWFGLNRPPYMSPGGGARARLFEAKEYLHKVPMWRLDAGLLVNSHETTHMRFADVSAALLHYKLMNVALRGREAGLQRAGTAFLEADADVEAIRRHSRYAARLQKLWRADLAAPGVTRELPDSFGLAARGLIIMSDAYRRWLEGSSDER